MRKLRFVASVWVALLAVALSAPAGAAPPKNADGPVVHTVYRGQTLGMIAKRYRVSVSAICHATGRSRSEPIQPGDKLVIPALEDEDGSQARRRRRALLGEANGGGSSKKGGKPRVHTVGRGQTLGRIAKRYHVSVSAICHANAISRTDPIRPGQKLVIPAPGDDSGKRARRQRSRLLKQHTASRKARKPKIHTVYRGHTLGKIARRYNVSVDAICHANDLKRSSSIKPGQKLVIPSRSDKSGRAARAWRLKHERSAHDDSPADRDWRDYKKPAWRRGYVRLISPNGDKSWKGYVIGPGNKLLPLARKKISDVLASWRTGKSVRIHPRLVRLIAKVSDTFGGRPIRVVSGFREHSYSESSRHPEGRALDFSIRGVPRWAVRDFLRRLPRIGVGYYPNSSFVHMDVRDEATYWVDMSGPGEPPRYVHISHGRAR